MIHDVRDMHKVFDRQGPEEKERKGPKWKEDALATLVDKMSQLEARACFFEARHRVGIVQTVFLAANGLPPVDTSRSYFDQQFSKYIGRIFRGANCTFLSSTCFNHE
jgi:hypothetical protein